MSFVAFIGGYFLASWFFFRYPHLIHRRKRIPFKCRHISHRGGAGENYENTMTAFKRAVALGTEMLELDVHLTKDDLVVVSHDHNLLRSTGVDKNISDLNYNELPLLKEQLPLDFDPDKTFVGSGLVEERKFPLLEEVFRNFPNIPVNIDIKVDNDKLIKEVSKLIKAHNREDLTVWGNFDNKITVKCYRENPRINLLFSMRRVIHLVLLFYSGLLPFYPIRESHLEIFLPSIYLRKKTNPPLHNLMVKTMDVLLLRPALFRHLQKRGIQTYVWVLNYENEFKTAFELGVDGVMTDYPTKLRKFLSENPEFHTNNLLIQ
ncbi:UNVERIFIED_CONTAM: hypothetical protein PYX00_005505 [Menopon gallinae]|uniref:GP-PDE domain-containing protein n=1 Tax=Menopon gallinae TaxID=328185 RepID=A0AAW2HRS3_9NEOP